MYKFYNDTSEHNPRMNNREGGWRWGEGGSWIVWPKIIIKQVDIITHQANKKHFQGSLGVQRKQYDVQKYHSKYWYLKTFCRI